jgi:hypothetical protein
MIVLLVVMSILVLSRQLEPLGGTNSTFKKSRAKIQVKEPAKQ